jgi:hypothetical protein
VIAEDLSVESPQHSLILRRGVDDGREELRFLTQISGTPRVGEREEIQNALNSIASRGRLDVLRDDR